VIKSLALHETGSNNTRINLGKGIHFHKPVFFLYFFQ